MRQAKLADDVLGGQAADQFQELSDAKVAENMAEHQSVGIAKMLLKQFEGMEAKK
jgi:flagellar protein FlgJ